LARAEFVRETNCDSSVLALADDAENAVMAMAVTATSEATRRSTTGTSGYEPRGGCRL
jgi:hypothetical protein